MKIFNYLMLLILFSCSIEEKLSESENAKYVIGRNNSELMYMTSSACQYTKYQPSDANYIANNISELRDLIASTTVADNSIIYLADNVEFVVTSLNNSIIINRPLKIVSGRGLNDSEGAKVYCGIPNIKLFTIKSNNVVLSGFRIIGHDTKVGEFPYSPGITWGVYNEGYDSLRVENCEISGWSEAGIELINSKNNNIINNYIHHNRRTGLGYGVSIHNTSDIETNALISCNFFEFNRHDIAGSGGKNQSYEASYNIIGEPGVLTHRFDMHGESGDTGTIAGTKIKIHHNQFNSDKDLAIMIRGVAEDGADIYNNTFKHKCEIQAIEQRLLNNILNRENWFGMNVYDNNYTSSNINNIDFNNYFLFKNNQQEIIKYTFGNECACSNLSETVGHGFQNYTKFLVGNWTGDGTDDLIALTNAGDLIFYKFNNGTFYGQQNSGIIVGNGFNQYKDFLVGNWTGDGTDDLIVLTSDNKMILFPFKNNTFYGQGGDVVVGHGFNNFKKFYVGNWTGDGTDDLLGLTNDNKMILFPFKNNTFYGQGGGVVVGHGFENFKDFFVGKWTGDGTDDLIGLTNDSSLVLFPFKNNTFYGQGGDIVIGTGFGNYRDFIVCKLPNKSTNDLIAINKSNKLYLFYVGNTLSGELPIGCIKDYSLILNGKWISNN